MFNKLLITMGFVAATLSSQAQCTFTTGVPYSESFNTFTVNNQLPTCWATSNSVTAITNSGTAGYAAFGANPSGITYFYTHGIQLFTSVVYSVGLQYAVDQPGSNWNGISILYSNSQSSVSLNMLVNSTVAVVSNTTYAPLTTTFMVSSSGIYYFAIRGVSNATATSQYLMWDDFKVSIPCTIAANQPSLTVTANPTTVCIGKSGTLTANGGNLYQWNTGATTKSIVVTPSVSGTSPYTVTATRTLTGCSAQKTIGVVVSQTPNVSLNALPSSICSGGTAVLLASGAQNYTWTGFFTLLPLPIQTITPNSTTTYSVTGANSAGCTGKASITVTVNPSPTVQVNATPKTICMGESAALQASGATTYSWSGGAGSGPSINVTPTTTKGYTVTGTTSGCTGRASVTVTVLECTGLSAQGQEVEISVFPNPNTGAFTITSINDMKLALINELGQHIQTITLDESNEHKVQLREIANGIYFIVGVNNNQFIKQKVIISQ